MLKRRADGRGQRLPLLVQAGYHHREKTSLTHSPRSFGRKRWRLSSGARAAEERGEKPSACIEHVAHRARVEARCTQPALSSDCQRA
eukprot:scaffold921_cov37-Tisochrysis_lutea.AAC.2